MRRRTLAAGLAAAALAPSLPAAAQAIDPALVDAANKEGEVVWYTTLIVGQAVRAITHPEDRGGGEILPGLDAGGVD